MGVKVKRLALRSKQTVFVISRSNVRFHYVRLALVSRVHRTISGIKCVDFS